MDEFQQRLAEIRQYDADGDSDAAHVKEDALTKDVLLQAFNQGAAWRAMVSEMLDQLDVPRVRYFA